MLVHVAFVAMLAFYGPQAEPPAPQKPADNAPDCLKLFQQAVEAAKTVKTATYDARRYGVGKLMDIKVPRISGHVTLEVLPEDKPLGVKLAVSGGSGESGKENPFELAYDGKTFAILFTKPQVVFSADPRQDKSMLDREEHKLILRELFSASRYAQPLDALALHYEGTRDVEGVACDVILVEFEPEESRKLPRIHIDRKVIRTRWFLAKEDHLPRRVEWKLAAYPDLQGAQAEEGLEMVISNLKVNPTLPPDAFKLPKPTSEASTAGPQAPGAPPPALKGDDKPGDAEGEKAPKQKKERLPKLEKGQVAPDFTLNDLQGKPHKLSDYRGKVVVLDFWAAWCRPCRDGMPGLAQIADQYKDKGVVVISLNIEPDPKDARELLADKPTSVLHLMQAAEAAKSYRSTGMPDYLVLDAQGKLVQRVQGVRDNTMLDIAKIIEVALKQGSSTSEGQPTTPLPPAPPAPSPTPAPPPKP